MQNEPSADATPSINPTNKAVGSKRNISTLDDSMAKLEDNSENNVKEDEILTSQLVDIPQIRSKWVVRVRRM